MEEQINKIAEFIAASKRVVAFTGAGISTESGIPDFRGPQGLDESRSRRFHDR